MKRVSVYILILLSTGIIILLNISVFQSLEGKLAQILRISFNQCPTVEAQLRLLEVFEGISGRELVQVFIQ